MLQETLMESLEFAVMDSQGPDLQGGDIYEKRCLLAVLITSRHAVGSLFLLGFVILFP